MNYQEILQYLYSINNGGIKLGLENMHAELKKWNQPEKEFKSIHIAGTNGKGSTSVKIATSLQLAGYKTGLFTSPHISSFRERIQINGLAISESDVVLLMNAIAKKNPPLTFFEMTTVLAYLYFASQKVDYAVIETGLGGRLDATNTLLPEACIITSIALDHKEILGDTLEKIASEKAGIIKDNTPLILGPRAQLSSILDTAAKQNASTTLVEGSFVNYDEENSAISKAALKQLGIPDRFIEKGIQALPPCRMELIPYHFPVILDVAHNPDGLTALFRSLKAPYPNIITGLSSSKDIPACLKIMAKEGAHLYLVEANHTRSAPKETLAKALDQLGYPHYTIANSIKEALDKMTGPTLICGSFFIMDEARKALGLSYPSDTMELQEQLHPVVNGLKID